MKSVTELSEYRDWLFDLKQQIKTTQAKAALTVNSHLIMLYWDLGKQIVEKQERSKWGSSFIEQLSKDLKEEFPEVTGFSVTNLNYCRRFFNFYSRADYENKSLDSICPQAGGKLQDVDCKGNLIRPQPVGKLQDVGCNENLIRPQLVDELQNVDCNGNLIHPQTVGKLQDVSCNENLIRPQPVDELQNVGCNGNLIRPQAGDELQNVGCNGNLIRPQAVDELQNVGCNGNLIRPQAVGELDIAKIALIPWGHQRLIIDKCKTVEQALFYINKTIENNWSRTVLEYQISIDLYSRQGKAVTNFSLTLPALQSDLANEMMKDPYNFDFLRLSEKVKETDFEKALVEHISHFLPELGIGFAYMGRQFTLKVGEDEYRTDLLFYHTRLRCYVIIELKTKKFEPEFVGKLNFYITAVNELVKGEYDRPTMGMLLCKNKNNYAVEFSLKDINNPIGVSTFHYIELTDDMKASLPTAEELQNELLNFERMHEAKQNEKRKKEK